MTARAIRILIIAAAVLGVAAPVHAATHRIAVVLGNNVGQGDLPPLRFAEDDAAKFGRVLVELGSVAPADLLLIQGGTRARVEAALNRAQAKIAAWRRQPGSRIILFVYYSGHSDGQAFELGRERFAFAELRRWLAATGAEVRLALIDTCKSGALVAAKGGAPGPAFQIQLSDDMASSGEVLLTSSAADEIALESREIAGSFFTHHLISGLRGAADTSGDARVTLSEAYQYAYAHTISTTGATPAGAQHPVYDYRISGRGELVITELSPRTARVILPPGHDRALVVDQTRHQVIAELGAGARTPLAVQAGDYLVRAWLAGRPFQGTVTTAAGETRRIRWNELRVAPTGFVLAKGDEGGRNRGLAARLGLRGGPSLSAAAGAQRGVADDLGVVPSLRIGIHAADPSGTALTLRLGTARAAGFRESSALLFAGYRWGWEWARLRAWVGLDVGGGAVAQDIDTTRRRWTGAAATGPSAGASIRVTRHLSVALDGQVPAALMRRNGGAALVWMPAAWLGTVVAF